MRCRVLVIGQSNVNLIQKIERIPSPGETLVSGGSYIFASGGNGALSAVAFARIGADCIICTKTGSDTNAQKLMKMFEKERIDSRFAVAVRNDFTSFSTTTIERDGTTRSVVFSGASPFITPAEIESAFTTYPDALYMQLNMPVESALAAADYAHENDTPIFIDAVGATANFPLDRLGKVEIFSPNEEETELLCGIRPINADTSLRACIKLASLIDTKFIVLKLGERGSYVYDGIYFHIIPHLAVPVVDTLAAGDIYTSALTYCYLQKSDIVEAARFANYSASLSVSRAGGYSSIPTLDQIKEFSAKYIDR